MKLFIDFITIMFIEAIYSFFSIYINLCYTTHKKIRSVIYSYWLINNKNRFYNFIGFNFNTVNLDHIYILNNLIYVNKNNFIPVCYESDYNYTIKHKMLSKIRYCFFYVFMYMFLDDVNNINGINTKVLNNKRYYKEINKRKFNKFAVIESVFSERYWLENDKVSFDVRSFFINRTYTYNYLRDKAYNSSKISNKCIGYNFDYISGKYVFTLNSVMYVRRQ